MRVMGIDHGDSRVGVAVSDALGWMAQGVETIAEKDTDKVIERIAKLVKEYEVKTIVVGLPKNMDGSIGFRGEITKDFIEHLKKHIDSNIVLWDERLTTVAASRTLNETNVRGKKRKKVIDTIAACYILQGYLDSMSKG